MLALIPLYAGAFLAASVPDLPVWASNRAFSPPFIPLTNQDRIFAATAAGADFLASGAVLVAWDFSWRPGSAAWAEPWR